MHPGVTLIYLRYANPLFTLDLLLCTLELP
jgi:hypothetical protein